MPPHGLEKLAPDVEEVAAAAGWRWYVRIGRRRWLLSASTQRKDNDRANTEDLDVSSVFHWGFLSLELLEAVLDDYL